MLFKVIPPSMLKLLGGSAPFTRADGEVITGDLTAPTGILSLFPPAEVAKRFDKA
jgi:hypothetical protein